ITGFSTTDGYTNISNGNNGTTNAYNNFSSMVVSQSPRGTFNYSVSVPGSTNVAILIDLDQDVSFDPDMELLALFDYQTVATTFTGSLTIPLGTPLGNYRMRVRSTYYFYEDSAPCGSAMYGETEDYTVSVVPVPSCIPPNGLAVDGVSFNTADI